MSNSLADRVEASWLAGLTEAQRHFVLMASDKPIHPYDIDVSGMVAKALVRKGIAYRVVCEMTATRESFNGYGLTPLGLSLKRALHAAHPSASIGDGHDQ